MKPYLALIFISLFLQGSCQTKTSGSKVYSSVSLTKDDSTFLALKDTAQAHLQTFIDSVTRHGLDKNYEFHVKSDFIEGDTHEHMWSMIFHYSDDEFKGVFIDSAFNIKKIKTGDKVVVGRGAVEDWIITNTRTGKQLGYYSEMYLKKKEK